MTVWVAKLIDVGIQVTSDARSNAGSYIAPTILFARHHSQGNGNDI